jgi:hypothetical protein
MFFSGFLDLRFHGLEIEARALLHGRIIDGRHGQLAHYLLNEHEAPELILEPGEIVLRSAESSYRIVKTFERIETKVRQYGCVNLDLGPYPAWGWSMKRYLKSSTRTAPRVLSAK